MIEYRQVYQLSFYSLFSRFSQSFQEIPEYFETGHDSFIAYLLNIRCFFVSFDNYDYETATLNIQESSHLICTHFALWAAHRNEYVSVQKSLEDIKSFPISAFHSF
jgi:hypothetical protein